MSSVAMRFPDTIRGGLRASAIGIVLVLIVGAGMFGRFSGLGKFPLAVDEYFFAQSVTAILEHGVPALDAGGYYSRGLLPQYVTAASVLVLGETELAYRLPAALFSVGTVFLAYVYGKRLLGSAVGLALAGMLLLSAWEIEFGRFARMYAALQFFTLLFFIAIDRVLCAHDRRGVYLPHVVLVVTIFTHELAILLVPFLLAYMMAVKAKAQSAADPRGIRFVVITATVALISAFYARLNPITFGVSGNLPVGYALPDASVFRLPFFPFFGEMRPEVILAIYLGLVGGVATTFALLQRRGRLVRELDFLAALLLLSTVFHQFLMAGSILLVMLVRRHVPGVGGDKRRVRFAVAASFGIGACWVAYAMSWQQWIETTWRPGYSVLNAFIRTFIGWPNLIDPLIVPWKEHLPLLGVCAILALLYQMVTKGSQDPATWVRNPAVVILPFVIAFSIFDETYPGVRYSFFFYPFVLALILLSAVEAASAVVGGLRAPKQWGPAIGVGACIGMFACSSDFNPRQIAGVAEQSVRLRTGEFEGYGGIWYDRWDFESPATFINEHFGRHEGSKAIVVGQEPVSYYLRVPHAIYYDRDHDRSRFANVSRAGGTVDLWSNQRLLSTPQELRDYTKCAANVWIVKEESSDRQVFEIQKVWEHRLARTSDVFRGIDDRLEVTLVELESGTGC